MSIYKNNKRYTNKIASKAYWISRGRVMEVFSMEEAQDVLGYFHDLTGIPLDVDDFFSRMKQVCEDGEIRHLTASIVHGELQICASISTEDCPVPEDLEDRYGVFCFVYNVDVPTYSEFGYCFFKKASSTYRRCGKSASFAQL